MLSGKELCRALLRCYAHFRGFSKEAALKPEVHLETQVIELDAGVADDGAVAKGQAETMVVRPVHIDSDLVIVHDVVLTVRLRLWLWQWSVALMVQHRIKRMPALEVDSARVVLAIVLVHRVGVADSHDLLPVDFKCALVVLVVRVHIGREPVQRSGLGGRDGVNIVIFEVQLPMYHFVLDDLNVVLEEHVPVAAVVANELREADLIPYMPHRSVVMSSGMLSLFTFSQRNTHPGSLAPVAVFELEADHEAELLQLDARVPYLGAVVRVEVKAVVVLLVHVYEVLVVGDHVISACAYLTRLPRPGLTSGRTGAQ
eukprot:CAMPEP_0198734702 /NCGR_PEP_ID=MMETSP1475-20131203/54658_1 /TAXON_ID= ORGANISM="Unidentified sp., Strain CCMP1999" /NCGR_SAMPLE_ID=MMETSP1475 /ASSEMBLY_ACC=CAM_ASM_001111 /LENGTH=313 /DNA_ID=CAMNT_0044498227 /DNA_START=2147 /DNA_END=3085 /DNA_ORIENTATION=-